MELPLIKKGCLSVPELFEEVKRRNRVRYLFGRINRGVRNRWIACHLHSTYEIDHLDGKLFF